MNWRWICGWLMTWGCLAVTGQVRVQGVLGSDAPIRFSQLGSAGGLNQYMSETWGVVGVGVVNDEDQPVDVLAAFGFSRDPDVQFARRIWIPPQAVRRTWVPIKLPRLPSSRETVAVTAC